MTAMPVGMKEPHMPMARPWSPGRLARSISAGAATSTVIDPTPSISRESNSRVNPSESPPAAAPRPVARSPTKATRRMPHRSA